jgi:hypothetical protein
LQVKLIDTYHNWVNKRSEDEVNSSLYSSLGGDYAVNGTNHWAGNSGWWVIETIESFNGQRCEPSQGTFIKWFSANAFGGSNFSNTPVGAVTHVEEPLLEGINDGQRYLGLWSQGKQFGISAWNSRNTQYFQAVGDPFVAK